MFGKRQVKQKYWDAHQLDSVLSEVSLIYNIYLTPKQLSSIAPR